MLKVKVSYTDEAEERAVLELFRPVMDLFKMKKSEGKPPYKHLYFTTKSSPKPRQ